VPRQVLDPDDPVSIGAMVGPEAFMEVRYLAHVKQLQALDLIPRIGTAFAQSFGRDSGGLVRSYRCEDAETVVVALGSVLGTIKDVIDERRERGERVGVLGITTFRPWPSEQVRAALRDADRIVVLEKAMAIGLGGIVSTNVRMSMAGLDPHVDTVIAGLGGRAITKTSLHGMLDKSADRTLAPLTFLDLNHELVSRELAREQQSRRSGPAAENMLRDVGAVAAGPV